MRTPLCILWLVCIFASAAHAASQDSKAYEPWRWTHYGIDSGLPSENIRQIVECPNGKTWVRTSEGFAYFDGYRWRQVGAEQGLPEGRALWIEAMDGGVVVQIDGTAYVGTSDGFAALDLSSIEEGYDIRRVIPSPDGESLLAQAHRRSDLSNTIFQIRDGRVDVLELQHELPSAAIPHIWRGAANEVFINTNDGLLSWGDEGIRMHLPALEPMKIYNFAAGPDGRGIADVQWPAMSRGLWRWDAEGDIRHDLDGEGANIESIGIAANGQSLVAYRTGDVRCLVDGEWTDFPGPPLGFGNPSTFCFRESGDLWMGTREGVYLFRGTAKRWASYAVGERDARDRVNEVFPARDGTIWLATDGGIAARHPDGSVEWTHDVEGMDISIVTGLAIDGDGTLWASSGSGFPGVVRFDGKTWTHVGQDQGLLAERVHKIRIDEQGRPWFLGMNLNVPHPRDTGPGAFVYENGAFTQWGTKQGLPNGRVYDFDEGPDGARWFATMGGISRWYAGEWTHWSVAQGLAIPRTFALEVDRQGRVWFTHQSGRGLGVLEPESGMVPRYLHADDGLAGNSIFDIAEDSRGWLWVTTTAGLNLVRDGTISALDVTMGLPHDHLWPVYPEKDRVLVGTLGHGLAVLDLSNIDRTPPILELAEPFVGSATVSAEWIAFAHEGSVSGGALRTRYRIDAEDWSPWSTARRARVPELKRGEHELEVQVAGLLGDIQERRTIRRFEVLPPLIQRPGFLLPVTVLSVSVLLLVWALLAYRRAHDDMLRKNEERYRDLWENANDLNYTHDLDHRLTSINRVTEFVLGHDRDDAVGRPLMEFVVPEFRDELRRALEHILAGEPPRPYELEIQTMGGERVLLEINTRLVESGGKVVGMQSVARDLTARRELEDQLRQSQKMEAVGRLAGGIAHDFNNVLVVINGYCDLMLQDGVADAESEEMVREIGLSGRRAAALTRQLLAFSRKQVLQPRAVDVVDLVAEMQDMLSRLIGEDVSLQLDLTHEAAIVRADPGQIQQVILNLVINARDAMPVGGTLAIGVDLAPEDSEGVAHVAMVVGDTGTGMDSKTLQRIFDPFFTTKQQGVGTGLGLSTVYGIVQQSGGKIEVDSEIGAGSRFTILFPALDASELESEERHVTLEPEPGSETILLVEDEPSVRHFVRSVLGRRGYRVIDAEDGPAAIREADRMDTHIDMLLTDVVMPGMSGPALAHSLFMLSPGLRTLFISGHVGEALARHGTSDEDIYFLQKPFTPSDLLKKVREVLRNPPIAPRPLQEEA